MPGPPTIFNATNTPQSGSAPLTVAFTSSVTGASTWASSAWDFGDGNTSTLQNPSHTYTSAGTYNPTVTIHAANSLSSTISYYSGSPGFEPVVVSSPPPTVTFSASATPVSGTLPLVVSFAATSSIGGFAITSASWDFGDGQTGTGLSVSHTYVTAGTFSPTCTLVTTSYGTQHPTLPTIVSSANPQVSLSLAGNIPQFFDNNGNVLAGGYLYTYLAGSSTTLATTYVDPAGDTSNANPVQLDSAGRPNTAFWLKNGHGYHFVVKARDNSTVLWSLDNVLGGGSSGGGGTGGVSSVFGRGGAVVAQGGDYDLSQMGDVSFSGLATNDVLQYNGTNWINLHAASVPGTIGVGAALPSSGTTGEYFYNTTDGLLYHWTGTAWTAAVPATVISGQITTGQVSPSAITSVQLASGAVTAAKTSLAAISASTGALNTGTVDAAQLLANAVTSVALASNAVTASKTSLAAIDASSGNLTANSVTSSNIVAGTIVSANIAAGTIAASNIAANTITAGQIASGTITATQIQAGTITGVQIQAGSINTAELAAGAVTASKLQVLVGSGNALPNASFEFVQGTPANRPGGYLQYNNGAISTSYTAPVGRAGGSTLAFGLQANASTSNTFGLMTSSTVDTGQTYQGGVQNGWIANSDYTISFYAKKVNGAGWSNMSLAWDNSPSTTVGNANPNLTTSYQYYSFTIAWGSVVEPNGALFLYVTGNTVSGDQIIIDDIQVETGDVATGWGPRTNELLPGSIVGSQIFANTITTSNIAAGTITGSNIAANTIVGGNILGGTITAGKIDSRGLTIEDVSGNVIFGVGATVNPSSYLVAPNGWLNSQISVASGVITGIGTGSGTTVDNSYVTATGIGAVKTDASNAPSSILNSTITVTGGQISGIGTGSGTYVDNGSIAISAGAITGIGIGTGTTVANSAITITGGAILGIGTGSGTAVSNSSITLTGSGGTIAINGAGGGTVTGIIMPGFAVTASNVSTYIASAAIGAAYIGSVDAGTITTGALRGVNVQGSAIITSGTYLAVATVGGDSTVYVGETTDFAPSGYAIVAGDLLNNNDLFTYTGITSNSLTGCSGVLAHTVNAIVMPQEGAGLTNQPSIAISEVNDSITSFAHIVTGIEPTATLNATGQANHTGYSSYIGAGHLNNTGSAHGIAGVSATSGTAGIVGESTNTGGWGVLGKGAGHGVQGQSTGTGYAGVHGYSGVSSGIGVQAEAAGSGAALWLTMNGTGVHISFNPILAALPTSKDVGDVIMAYTTGGSVGARTGTPRLMFWDGSSWYPFALSSAFTG